MNRVQGLFAVFFKALRPHFPFIDPKQSDPLDVAKRSLPLFNASKESAHSEKSVADYSLHRLGEGI